MSHSYEEIRKVALDILAGREQSSYLLNQYDFLSLSIGKILAERDNRINHNNFSAEYPLDSQEKGIFLELFWDFFRQGIITLGYNDANREFPFFRLTQLGNRIAAHESIYFFHDVSSYETAIRKDIPEINDITLIYIKESMQAFRSGCLLSSTVMLGVATEHTFLRLLDVLESHPQHSKTFASVFLEKTILRKVNKFKNILDSNLVGMPSEIKEDLDTNFNGILSVIRNFRNQSGHPTGKIIDREQVFILLQLFIPYCRKLYQLTEYFHKQKDV